MTSFPVEAIDKTAAPARSLTVVCVTDQMRCDRIIKAGKLLCELTGSELSVINVSRTGQMQDPESIEYLYKVSSQNGAVMTVIYADDVAKAIIKYIKENKVSYVLTGIPGDDDSVINRIWSRFTHIAFFMVEQNGELHEVLHPARAAMALRQG